MFFLLRMAFWLGVVCVLLPGSGTPTNEARIDTATAVTAASAAVSDMRGFCDRQPEACVAGGKIAVALGHKAESGARTIIEFVTNRMSEPDGKQAAPEAKPLEPALTTASTTAPRVRAVRTVPVAATDNGTLTRTDVAAPWHAPVPLPPRREARAARPSV